MKKLNRKSLFFGAMLPIIAIIFMGGVNVLERYHTIKAKEVQLIDDNGNTILSLSKLPSVLNAKDDVVHKADRRISDLENQIDALISKLNRIRKKPWFLKI